MGGKGGQEKKRREEKMGENEKRRGRQKTFCCGVHTQTLSLSLTVHLVLQAVHEGPAGPRGDEVDGVGVHLLLGGVVRPLPSGGELAGRVQLLGSLMGRALPLQGREETSGETDGAKEVGTTGIRQVSGVPIPGPQGHPALHVSLLQHT